MDVLIQEIAKTFNIGNEAVQNIINNYPQLRQQIALYNVTTMVQGFDDGQNLTNDANNYCYLASHY